MSVRYAGPETGLWPVLFPREEPRVIAFTGGGGKTSAIRTLAAELASRGRRVVITTTTKMHPPEDPSLLCGSADELHSRLRNASPLWAGVYHNEYKIEGLPDALPALAAMADHVLIEADGARRLPLKMIDRRYEPVIPPEADAVVALAGMDGIGKPVALAVHRPALACAALDVSEDHIVTPRDAARLLTLCYDPGYVILNKADTPALRALAEETAACLPEAVCVITSLRAFGYQETR